MLVACAHPFVCNLYTAFQVCVSVCLVCWWMGIGYASPWLLYLCLPCARTSRTSWTLVDGLICTFIQYLNCLVTGARQARGMSVSISILVPLFVQQFIALDTIKQHRRVGTNCRLCLSPPVLFLFRAVCVRLQDSRHLYLLMDFCAGGDLKSLVR